MDSLYQRLSSNHFRLLKVTGAYGRDLRFQFVHNVSGRTRPCTAVSYTWGDDMKSEVIYVNDKPFHGQAKSLGLPLLFAAKLAIYMG
jgi:hypothetical protein